MSYAAAKPGRMSKSQRNIPLFVIEVIASIIENERGTFSEYILRQSNSFEDLFGHIRLEGDPSQMTLSSMSLVHRSWTSIAQKEMGRQLIVLRDFKLKDALDSVLFGPWTRCAYIGNHPTASHPRSNTNWTVSTCVQLLGKLSRLRHLILCLDLPSFNGNYNHSAIFTQVSSLKQIRRLELRRTDNGVPNALTMCIARMASALPLLEQLRLDCWEAPALVLDSKHSFYRESPDVPDEMRKLDFGELRPPKLTAIEFVIGPNVPLDFISWILSSAYDEDAGLRVLSVKVSKYLPRLVETHPRRTLTDFVTAIEAGRCLSILQELSISLASASKENVDGARRILETGQSSTLKSVNISDESLSSASLDAVLWGLPSSVEELHYNLRVRVSDVNLVEKRFTEWIQAREFKTRFPSLQSLSLSIVRVVRGSEVFTTQQKDHRTQSRPLPALANACDVVDVNLRAVMSIQYSLW